MKWSTLIFSHAKSVTVWLPEPSSVNGYLLCAWWVFDKLGSSMIDHLLGTPLIRKEELFVNVHTGAHFSCPLVKQNLWNAEEGHFGAQSYYKQVSSALCSQNTTHGLHFYIKASACTSPIKPASPLHHSNSFLWSEINPCHSSPAH